MRNPLVILVLCFCSLTNAVPLGLKKNMAIVQEQEDPMLMMAEDEETRPEMMISRLNLPSNATSIRADITDGFSCDNKTYGYYADVENECQIFHVCLPVTYADGKENTFRWSFICPEETVFSQEYFTCMRSEDMSINCEESFKYYELNRNFGMIEPEETPADEADEDMNMEEMSRQPSTIQGEEEPNKQSIETAPIKKQTNKAQNSNRRKTQANRVSIEAQRKKIQPVRRLPKPAVVATTAKPIVEESPILEQEVERTTLKYQRLTKRPIAVIPEQPKPEEPKPEKEVLRQELFAQKRKRPQIYFPSRFDVAQQTDSEPNPLPFLKTDMPKQPELVVQNQAESQAQASEIAEVSIKPQIEKIDNLPVLEKEPVQVKEEEIKPIVELKSEIAPLPENIPSRVEVVEIPIQKVDEPLMAEGEAVLAQAPAPEEPKPVVSVIEPIKGEEVEIPAEDILLKKIVAQIEKVAEPMKPVEEEKMPNDQILEPELVTLDEPKQSLEALKSAELPKPLEPVKTEETIMESKIPESEVIPQVKLEESLAEEKPENLPKVEIPVVEEKLESEVLPKVELSAEKPVLVEVPAPEKLEESQMALKINVAAPEVPELEAEKPKDLPEDSKPQVVETEVVAAQPEKTLIVENVETPVPEPEVLLKLEVPEVKPEEPLAVESSVPAIEKNLYEKMPSVEEAPAPELNMQMDLEAPTLESMEKLEKQSEVEEPLQNEKIVKIMETIPDAKIELPIEPVSKPLESLIEPVKEEISESELLSAEVQAEKASELSADEQMRETEANAEKEIVQSANDNEEAQSLILDFISSLVNSENSNFEDQSVIGNEMSSDSLPEASIPEQVIAEAEPVKIQTEDSQINPLYIPVMPNNDQMYQIPVQVIETPEPEPIVPVPEPKLPLTVDDVVELVKESLDNPTVEKENIVQEQSSNDDDGSSQPESEEVKPIYHRYIELGSNLLKSEALTASDDEPVITPTENEKSVAEKEEISPELPKAITEEKLPEPEQLAAKTDSLPEVPAIQTEKVATEVKLDSQLPIESLKEGRSLNRFRMDPRKRRFLFRSDAR
ncbi:titin [Episyrphus balteatus]|uniref:titin n=1 Tax=Episyrphus balteatus TaxID=286459 RepID=UPI00248676B4|nr:titin [Episyrphus balteatus]